MTFCLLHGKWHDGSCWAPLRERLPDSVAPDMPFHDTEAGYAARIRPALDALGDDVVLVAHSLSAAYAPLIAAERPVERIVYLCPAPAGLLGVKAGMQKTRPGFPWPPDDERGVSEWEPAAAIAAMYPRLEPALAEAAVASLNPSGPPPGDYPLSEHPDVPVSLVYADHDEFFEPEWSRWAAENVLGVEPIELRTGHFPMLEDPEGLAALLRGL